MLTNIRAYGVVRQVELSKYGSLCGVWTEQCVQAAPFLVFGSPLQFQRRRSMRHLMPIVTPRLNLRPPMLGDLESIQSAKEEA